MTVKRFMVDDAGTLIDMHTRDTFDYVSDVCDLLNEQHETIQKLNQQLRIFSDGLKAEIRETKEVFEDYSECLDEKKQLKQENEQLKTQLQNTSDQRNEFHRGARENANRVGKLEEENKQLKQKLDDWHKRTFKAHEYFNILEKIIDEVCDDDVSNKIWKEYEKREKLIE